MQSAERTQSVTNNGEYTDEEREFLRALDAYKRTRKRPWPTWSEILAVVHSLGYRKVEPTAPLPKYGGSQILQEGHKDKGGAQP